MRLKEIEQRCLIHVYPFRQGVMKTPVSTAQGSGGYDYNVVPRHSERSILLYRMNSVEAGVAMPDDGRTLIHDEG